MKKIDGVSDVRDDLSAGEPEFRMKLKPAARHLGLTPEMLSSYIETAFGELELSRFQRGTDEARLMLVSEKQDREFIYQLLDANIPLADGTLVPLVSVAEIDSVYTAGYIHRENSKRNIEVKAALDKDIISAGKVMEVLESNFIKDIEHRMPDVKISAGGEFEEEGGRWLKG